MHRVSVSQPHSPRCNTLDIVLKFLRFTEHFNKFANFSRSMMDAFSYLFTLLPRQECDQTNPAPDVTGQISFAGKEKTRNQFNNSISAVKCKVFICSNNNNQQRSVETIEEYCVNRRSRSSMDESPDFDQESWKEQRIKALGYKPQHEVFHNFFLPYSDKLDAESAELLDHIKQELGRTLAMREINPGAGIFLTKLMR